MKSFAVLVNDTLEALENYAQRTKQTYPDDMGYSAVKKCAIKCFQADGVAKPGAGLVVPVVEAVNRELTAIQFEKYGLGIDPY